ncbi:hypothetical protein GCM10010425_20400 [Streptomyces spororaveus]|uniref:DinB family protein n=1 Tax=Streptomyces spororaveus TaxID=284039 RepID=A0ABQ3T7A9_9ACTN|nr:hypothetical protein [Streptomyces spororaveus]GHI76267.1 hypothetical protein Sspor_18280 [Streptomyces spororaveus]
MTHPDRRLHELRLQQLALYLLEAEQILAAWDTYSDQHTGPDGWPHDETAYGFRQAQRDADTWRSFNRIHSSANDLVAIAEVQLQKLPERHVHPRWAWQISTLYNALGRLNTLQGEWLDVRATLPTSARPGVEEYDGPLAARNAEVWHHLDECSLHGQAVLDINTAIRRTKPRPSAAAHTAGLPGPGAAPAKTRR